MYYPYLRGKQNELILLRDQAELIASSKIIPIIEPVKKNLNPLFRAFDNLNEYNAEYILIINPIHGDFEENNSLLLESLPTSYNLIVGINKSVDTDINLIKKYIELFSDYQIAIIHQDFGNGKEFSNVLSQYAHITKHIFVVEGNESMLYQNHFSRQGERILIQDAFKKQNNKDYVKEEYFSELHLTYKMLGLGGFGDFLIVGDDYSVSGGPAYAVAIHLTYINSLDEDKMFIKHYKSKRVTGITDPGGKFLEALDTLVDDIKGKPEFDTNACKEFISLHKRKHFPGLGSVKKLSMQHHIEIFAKYLG
ncbi:sce7725 family protein [Aliarcobacter butzleri]|uniref:sce7725 family protein n=1 Tax=Aliarcobacter butzleri TaxID=28197 RepID=UPI00125F92F6|nr:sce7725 family protein [Aliarcobacter butzleri]MCT7595848.1 sce7725 family protein [Aliarcobacter butzleri]MCT7600363.1 sce7725 family protein [Aliarcobacter butzleri]MCT7649130.1 sce7725 family protein [Aliarcobacter butzleri]MCT7652675.1 sce7725 family protein [Aliarcobacter butzleri]